MREISRTKIKTRARRKTNPEVIRTLSLAMKSARWKDVAKILSGPTKLFSAVNLDEIDKQTKEGDTIVVPGKVLSKGELSKRVNICALAISSNALSKLKKSKSEFVHLAQEIEKNAKAEGVKIVR